MTLIANILEEYSLLLNQWELMKGERAEGGRGGEREGIREEEWRKEVGRKEGCQKWKEWKKLSSAYMQDQKKLGTIRNYLPELFPKNLVLKQVAVVEYGIVCLVMEAPAFFL